MELGERFEELYKLHHHAIWAYLVRRLPEADARDAAAEVFEIAWRRLDEVPPEPETLLWLYGTARWVLANAVRAIGRRRRLNGRLFELRDVREPAIDPPISEYPEVLAALARLGEAEREVILLSVWEDLRVCDIARILALSPNAVSLRLARARKHLSRDLADLITLPMTGRNAR